MNFDTSAHLTNFDSTKNNFCTELLANGSNSIEFCKSLEAITEGKVVFHNEHGTNQHVQPQEEKVISHSTGTKRLSRENSEQPDPKRRKESESDADHDEEISKHFIGKV